MAPPAGPLSTSRTGKRARGLHRADAARGHHQQQRTGCTDAAQSILHPRKIAIHHRQHIGVRDHRRGPLVFANLTAYLRGDADRQMRQHARHHLARTLLMRGVYVGMEEADRQRLDLVLLDRRRQTLQRILIQREQHRSVGGKAFRHLQAADLAKPAARAVPYTGRTAQTGARMQSPASRESHQW